MTDLSLVAARKVIEALSNGNPPEYGLDYFSAGLDPYLSVLDKEYLATFIQEGGSAFKMVVGVYGGGKTHFLYSLRDLAWSHKLVVSYVSLSHGESPFHKLELVYGAIARGLVPPLSADELLSGYEKGIASFIKSWYAAKIQMYRSQGSRPEEAREAVISELEATDDIESISFMKAVKAATRTLATRHEDEFYDICQWLTGEGYDRRVHGRHGILQRIDRTSAFVMLRSLVQWIRQLGYNGLVILLDEAERVPSLSTKQREQHLSNLREIIDECSHATFQRVMIFYAVPDENFLEGRAQVYEALKQRVSTVFDSFNPSGVKIELEHVVDDSIGFLREVGDKLARVYEVAYDHKFDTALCRQAIEDTATSAYSQRYGDIGYKRLFVQNLVAALHNLRRTGKLVAGSGR